MNELIKELKEYNFLEKSVISFSREYYICEKTVLKYLRLNRILYRRKGVKTCIPRDRLGRFTLNEGIIESERKEKTIRVFSNYKNDEKEDKALDVFIRLAKKCKAKK